MNRDQRRQRQRTVTDEPFVLDPALEGRRLAGMGRRSLAIVLDLLILALVGTPLLLAVTLGALYVQTPALATTVVDMVVGDGSGEQFDRCVAELLSLVARRQPGAVPLRYAASLSTLGLGFLQALRDPNRQALHDRIARTVVIRDSRRE